MSEDKDKDRRDVLRVINAQIIASHQLNADPSNFVINQNSLADALTDHVATVRREVWNETFKIQCVDCAEGDEPVYSKEARWFYHGISNQEVGCSASKLRIAALEHAADSREGGNDANKD